MYIILIIEDLKHIQVVQNKEGETKLFYTKVEVEEFEEGINEITKIVKV